MKVNHFGLIVYVKYVDMRAETFMPLGSYACIHVPIVPVCVHMYHLWYPIPDCYLLKCLWAALCGFPSLEGLVVLNADCHDVSSKPQPCLLCVTVTIYFRTVCEKQLSFHLCNSLTWTVGSKTVLLLLGQNHHPNGCAH